MIKIYRLLGEGAGPTSLGGLFYYTYMKLELTKKLLANKELTDIEKYTLAILFEENFSHNNEIFNPEVISKEYEIHPALFKRALEKLIIKGYTYREDDIVMCSAKVIGLF